MTGRRAASPVISDEAGVGTLARAERFLHIFTKYPTLLSVLLNALLVTGWVLDRTVLRVAADQTIPRVNVFTGPPEANERAFHTFLQVPPYKAGRIQFGGRLTIAPRKVFAYSINPIASSQGPVLLLTIAGESFDRAFPLMTTEFLPFTVEISTGGRSFLLAVEAVDEKSVQVRTFQRIQG
jgi:hypothetical protein